MPLLVLKWFFFSFTESPTFVHVHLVKVSRLSEFNQSAQPTWRSLMLFVHGTKLPPLCPSVVKKKSKKRKKFNKPGAPFINTETRDKTKRHGKPPLLLITYLIVCLFSLPHHYAVHQQKPGKDLQQGGGEMEDASTKGIFYRLTTGLGTALRLMTLEPVVFIDGACYWSMTVFMEVVQMEKICASNFGFSKEVVKKGVSCSLYVLRCFCIS